MASKKNVAKKKKPPAKRKKVEKKKAKPKKAVGRKLFDGQNENKVLTKLKNVWGIGGSDAEASMNAEISTASLSRYLVKHPKVEVLRNALREKPILRARRTIVKNLSKVGNSQWYLERKRKKEFSTKSVVEHEGEVTVMTAKEKKQVAKAFKDNA